MAGKKTTKSVSKKATLSSRVDGLESKLDRILDSIEAKSTESTQEPKVEPVAKTTAKEIEKVNESIRKILQRTEMNPDSWYELHRFGKSTSISMMPESKNNTSYVDGTRAIRIVTVIPNTRDGWENFTAIMDNLFKKFESHNAFYRQVNVSKN